MTNIDTAKIITYLGALTEDKTSKILALPSSSSITPCMNLGVTISNATLINENNNAISTRHN